MSETRRVEDISPNDSGNDKESAMTAAVLEEPTIAVSLTIKDVGDCCGAAAQTRWESPVAQTLQFCGHHTRKHGAALTLTGWRVVNVSGRAALALVSEVTVA